MNGPKLSLDETAKAFCEQLRAVQEEHGDKGVMRYVLSGYDQAQPEYQLFMELLARGDFYEIARAVCIYKPLWPMSLEGEAAEYDVDPAVFGRPPIFMMFVGDKDAPDVCIHALAHFMMQVPGPRSMLLGGDEPGVQLKSYLLAKKLNWRNVLWEVADEKRYGVLASTERDKSLLHMASAENVERAVNEMPEALVRVVVFTMNPDQPPGHVRAVMRKAEELDIEVMINPPVWEDYL